MIYSRSAEYAIRATVALGALKSGEYGLVRTIAKEAEIPPPFLAKLLQDLARDGFLKSSKGPRGGFRLAVPASDLTLMQIVDSVDGTGAGRHERCPGGHPECSDRVACALHETWMPLRQHVVEYLQGTTIAALVASLQAKRRALARRRAKKVPI